MSSTAAPYGLVPVKKLGGQPYNNSFSQYTIATGYNTSIFKGDLVNLQTTNGTINKDTGTTSATPIGVFVGCQYTDATIGLTFKPIWVAGTAASDAVAFVVDDPDVIFKIQGDGLGTIYDYESIGTNAALIQTAGNTTTGVSKVALDSDSVLSTAGLPLKIVGWDKTPSNAIADTFVDFHVILNTHFWRTTLANPAV